MRLEQIVDMVVNEVKACTNKVVIIHGNYNYGKSTMIRRLFEECQYIPKIFQSGCNPAYREIAVANLVSQMKLINKITANRVAIFLDELDDDVSLATIFDNNDLINKAIICTNCDINLSCIHDSMVIDLGKRYAQADDYILAKSISPGEFLCQGKQEFDSENIVKKKKSIHSMTIVYSQKFREVSTIFYNKE